MKKGILLSTLFFGVIGWMSNAEAQTGGLYKNTLKIGASAGASVPNNNTAASVGVDLSYQYLLTSHFGIGLSTGYQHNFGREKEINNFNIQNNDVGLIPAALLLRYYPKATGVYVGADVGYGFLVGEERVAENRLALRPDGGAYVRPTIGYHNRKWNAFVHYTKVIHNDNSNIAVGNDVQKYNVGNIGVGFSYNIGLGAGK